MASKIVRCIKGVENINTLSDNVTEVNDIVSDINGNIYIRKEVGFHKLYNGDGANVDDIIDEIKKDIERLDKDISKIDLTYYAKKSDLIEYAKTDDLKLYAKKDDLEDYTKKSDLTLYVKFSDLDTYAKKSDLAVYVKLTDLNEYAKKSDLPDLTEYAKKSELPDLSPYAKKSDIPSEPDLSNLVTQSELDKAQKYKITKDDGSPLSVGVASQELIDNAPTGIQYFTKMIGVNEHNSSNAGYLITLIRSSYRKQLWLPYNTTNHLTRYYDGSSWSDWEKQLSQRDFDDLQAQIDELKK